MTVESIDKNNTAPKDVSVKGEKLETQNYSIEGFIQKKGVDLPGTLRVTPQGWRVFNNPKILGPLQDRYGSGRDIVILVSNDGKSIQARLTGKDYDATITLTKKDIVLKNIVLSDEVVGQFINYYNSLVEKIEKKNNPTRVSLQKLKDELSSQQETYSA